jgi:hypothetical protein
MSFLARDIQRKLTFDNSKSENSCEEEETEGEFEGKKSSERDDDEYYEYYDDDD